jgi:hypothetical protein
MGINRTAVAFVLGVITAVTLEAVAQRTEPVDPKTLQPPGGGRVVPFVRFGPDEHGVICYVAHLQTAGGLSCLKLK